MHTPPAFTGAKAPAIFQREINDYLKSFPEEISRLHDFSQALSTCKAPEDFLSRKSLPWHITASGIVAVAHKLLVIRHPFLGAWIPPGGHVEAAESPQQAAMRELHEETGMRGALNAWHLQHAHPLDIDAHPIPASPHRGEPAHWHYDFRYLLQLLPHTNAGAELEYGWKSSGDILFGGIQRLQEKLANI